MSTSITITRSYEVPDEFCADVLYVALNGGVNYWATVDAIVNDADNEYISACLTDAEGLEKWEHRIDYAAIRRGIERVLTPGFQVNRDIRTCVLDSVVGKDAGHIGTDVADVIIQAACFGEIVYG